MPVISFGSPGVVRAWRRRGTAAMLERGLRARPGESWAGPVLVVFGVVHAELALVVGVQAMLAVRALPVALPDLRLACADCRSDLGPRRTGHKCLVHERGVAVVAGQHLPGRQNLQVLGGGQRRVLA